MARGMFSMQATASDGESSGRRSGSRSARGVYGISVAAELSGVGPQTLRLYERWGLLTPFRTAGGTRRYSDDDLDRLQQITELVDQGVNLAGIGPNTGPGDPQHPTRSDNAQLQLDNAKLKADRRSAANGTGSTPGRKVPQDDTRRSRRVPQ